MADAKARVKAEDSILGSSQRRQVESEGVSAESPIHHTEGGQMPDVKGEGLRRVRADAALLGEGRGPIILGLVGVIVAIGIGLGFGISYFLRQSREEGESFEEAASA